MKKVIFGLGLLSLAVYFLIQKNPSKIEGAPEISVIKPLKTREPLPSIKELAKKKIDLKKKSIIKDTTQHPCNQILETLLESSLEEIKENSKDFYANLRNPKCQNSITPVFKNNPQILDLEKQCLNKETLDCDSLLFFLKTWAVSMKYPDDIDPRDLDETILANKIMFNFTANPSLPKEILDKNLILLEEIISKDPSLYGVQKAKLIHLFAKGFQYGDNLEEEFQNTLDSIGTLRSDPEVEEMLIVKKFIEKNFDNEKTLSMLNDFMKNFPENPKGPYYRAAIEWNIKKDPHNTKFWLEKAKKLAPSDPQVRYSLDSLKNAKPNQSIFYFSFHFDLEAK